MIPLPTALAILLATQASDFDRADSLDDRAALLMPYAAALAVEARSTQEALLVAAVFEAESHGDSRVLLGMCGLVSSRACDSGRARGGLQVQLSACRAAFAFPEASPQSIRAEVRCAVRLLRFGADRCKAHALTPMHGAISTFAGRGCTWSGADARVRAMRRVLAGMGRVVGDARRAER